MKRAQTAAWAAAIMVGAAVGGWAAAARPRGAEDPPKPVMPANMEEMQRHMAEMAALASPAAEHKALADRAGRYTIANQFWMNADDRTVPPMESAGEATITSVLGGRFVMQDETASLGGQAMASVKYWGYNRETKEYEAVWSYTGSTAMMILKGTSADGGKTVRYSANVVAAGRKERFEVTVVQVSPDSFSVEVVGVMEDGTKGGRIVSTYTRAK